MAFWHRAHSDKCFFSFLIQDWHLFYCWKANHGFEIVTQLANTKKTTIFTSVVYGQSKAGDSYKILTRYGILAPNRLKQSIKASLKPDTICTCAWNCLDDSVTVSKKIVWMEFLCTLEGCKRDTMKNWRYIHPSLSLSLPGISDIISKVSQYKFLFYFICIFSF